MEIGFYGCIVSNNNIVYDMLPNTLTLPMHLWSASNALNRYKYYCEVTVSAIIFTTVFIFSPFLKHFYNNITIILGNLSSLPISTYRDIAQRITEGQSLDIQIGETRIISIPAKIKINISEEELENIAPMKLPKNVLNTQEIVDKCAICQDPMNYKKEMCRILPKCKHGFHCHCIDTWFFSGHIICPICRDNVR